MLRRPKLNIQHILSAICIFVGVVILWRTFVQPAPALPPARPTTVAEQPTATPSEAEQAPAVEVTEAPLPPAPTLPSTLPGYPAPQNPPTDPALIPTAVVVPSLPGAPANTPLPAQPTLPAVPTPQPVVGVSPVVTAVAPTPIPSPTPVLTASVATATVATAIPTTAVDATATPTPTATPETLTPGTATATPTASATPTATATPTPTLPSGAVLMTYRIEGSATKVVISYIDAAGNDKDLEATLPWRFQFYALPEADLAVTAYSNDEEVPLSCAIEVNNQVVITSQTFRATDGVTCERFLN